LPLIRRCPAGRRVPLPLRRVGDLAGPVAHADVERGLSLQLTAIVDHDGRLDREAARRHVDPAQGVPVDSVQLGRDRAGDRLAERVHQELGQVQEEAVAVVPAVLVQGGVVRREAVHRAVIGHPDEQGAALPAVRERGDGLDGRGLERLEHLAGAGPGAQRRLVL